MMRRTATHGASGRARLPGRMSIPVAFMLLTLAPLAIPIAAHAADPLKDWPCKAPQAEPLTAAMVWPGGMPAELAAALPAGRAWEGDPAVRDAVEFMASPENPAGAAERVLASLAATPGRERRATLLLALSGVVDLTNRLRDIMVDGVGLNVVRSRLLAEVVNGNDAALHDAAGDPGEAAAIRQARFWNLRGLDKVEDDAGMLCRRLAYSERKLRSLAALIQKAMLQKSTD